MAKPYPPPRLNRTPMSWNSHPLGPGLGCEAPIRNHWTRTTDPAPVVVDVVSRVPVGAGKERFREQALLGALLLGVCCTVVVGVVT